MSKSKERYKDVKDFGKSLGLSDLEMELIMQKKKIIAKLKKSREKKGLTQSELAEMVGSKQPSIARMESGQVSEVSMDFLCKVAFALDMSVTIKGKVA